MCAGWLRSGFAAHLRVVERYDPSLPPVWGNRDQLVQVLLNLVKNAAEAMTDAKAAKAEITLITGLSARRPSGGAEQQRHRGRGASAADGDRA